MEDVAPLVLEEGPLRQIEPGDAEELAEKIAYLVSKPEEIQRMGRSARRVAEERYSVEKHYESIMSLYERVLR